MLLSLLLSVHLFTQKLDANQLEQPLPDHQVDKVQFDWLDNIVDRCCHSYKEKYHIVRHHMRCQNGNQLLRKTER